jgi:hypothetical protein
MSCVGSRDTAIPSDEEIVQVARQKAAELGYPVDRMSVEWDKQNLKWHEWIDWVSTHNTTYLDAHPDLRGQVDRGECYAVYLTIVPENPNSERVHGDVWVFVSRTTGMAVDWIPHRPART